MEPLLPVNENIGSGTGIGTLIPTCPASTPNVNFLAAAPLVVKIAVPLPYLLALIVASYIRENSRPKPVSIWIAWDFNISSI